MRAELLWWVFLVSLFVGFSGFDPVLVSGQCQTEQRLILLRLRNGLSFDSASSDKLGWNQSSDCCEWAGVTCDESGRVIGLDLSAKSISGGVDNSSSLFDLRHLRILNLSYNSFGFAQIPSQIGKLEKLAYLNLSNAGFGGQIPIEVSQLTSLVSLDFSTLFPGTRSLKLENPNLAVLVQNLKGLQELFLDGVNISWKGEKWCKALSSSLPNLQVLSMSNCYLSGPIDSSLRKLQKLTNIRLDNNNFSTPVPDIFGEFPNLISLRLSHCNLSGILLDKVFQLPKLQALDVSNNQLLRGSLQDFPRNGSLQVLVLSFTGFSGLLPESVDQLTSLSRIELSNCSFYGPIPSSMEKLKQLVYLDFSSNQFNGSMPSFSKSRRLTQIIISHNDLSGPIPADWSGLENLVNLDLRNNTLNGSIPQSLFSLPSLKMIHLSGNKFSGSLTSPPKVQLSQLNTLDLSSNNLEGHIPYFVLQFRGLKILSLAANNFNGSIRLAGFRRLENLTNLDLSYNNLSVVVSGNYSLSQISTLRLACCRLEIFPDLRNQSKLSLLDLSDNQIRGPVPNWIWNLGPNFIHLNLSHNQLTNLEEPYTIPALTVLDLHANLFSGKLPNLPQSALYLDFSLNKFSSSIAPNIGDFLAFTVFLSLSNNNLTGSIPQSLCGTTYIQVLDLSNNQLGGEIPSCLIEKSSSLGVLNLRKNRLQGTLAGAFPRNCTLQTLDLNGNHIKGQVPRSLANCTKLEILNIGNNQIEDEFPCHLKNISHLRVLVLRSNRFHGPVGCLGNEGSWHMLQIVDLASNNFNGTLPNERLRLLKALMGDGNQGRDHLQFEFLELSGFNYYQDSITVTSKGLQLEFTKILTVFTSIDFSGNSFEGPIPDAIGDFKGLLLLNLSHNGFTGHIPAVLGDLKMLESLDISSNELTGEIPEELGKLTFLGSLNFSNNRLVGMIPKATQLQSFSEDTFKGNEGLCGKPLKIECGHQSPPAEYLFNRGHEVQFDWKSIFTGIGYGIGAGAAIVPMIFWKEASKHLDESVDKILMVILPVVGLTYKPSCEWDTEAEEESADDDTETWDEDSMHEELGRRYCIFCSKLDSNWKTVIHDPTCACFGSPPPLFSSESNTPSSFSP